MKNNTNNTAMALTDSNAWDALPSLIQGSYTMAEASELYQLIKEQADDEVVEYQQLGMVDTVNPELVMELKEEAEQMFESVDVEEVFEAKAKEVDDTLVYSDETGMVKDFEQVSVSSVRMTHKEFMKAKAELRQELKARRLVLGDLLSKLKDSNDKAIKEQAKATGVDPAILARVMKSEALKKAGKARVYVTRS